MQAVKAGMHIALGCVLGAFSLTAMAGQSIDESVTSTVSYIEQHNCQYDAADFDAGEAMGSALHMKDMTRRMMMIDYLKERGLLKAQGRDASGKDKPLKLQTKACGGQMTVETPSSRLASALKKSKECDLTPAQLRELTKKQGIGGWEASGALRVLLKSGQAEVDQKERLMHLHLGHCKA